MIEPPLPGMVVPLSSSSLTWPLPDEFTREQYRQMRASQGKDGTGDSTLRTWTSRGYIIHDEITQSFRKTESYLKRAAGSAG